MLGPDIPSLKRCAIYTRKSTNHLLDRDMNSLETQRDVCSAYIASQRHRGWVEIPDRYDDGGQSGTNIERPALAALMRDIESGLVDVVVIYKIDRLTRSLSDFVRMMEVFDRYGIPFVSISQSFDTSDSVGRMIVNILLTFSQFEQELISERVRDNIRARKRRGKWAGGIPPVGYISVDGELQIVEEEAEIVRFIYAEFLRGGSYMAAKRAVQAAGCRTAVKPMKKASTQWGGRLISSGHVYAILHNPIYVGEIRGHESTYPGTHEPIISRETWDAARSLSAERKRQLPHSKQTDHFLPGLLWDSLGRRMLLTIEKDRGRLYYYYSSSNALWSQRESRRQYRSHAARLDALVVASVANFLSDREKLRSALKSLGVYGPELDKLSIKGTAAAEVLSCAPAADRPELFHALVETIELAEDHISITFRSVELRRFLLWGGTAKFRGRPADWKWSDARYVLEIAVRAVSARRTPVLHIRPREESAHQHLDSKLIRLIQDARLAQQMVDTQRDRTMSELAAEFGRRKGHFAKLVRLNYLAPDIVTSIFDGTQPPMLTRDVLYNADLPLDWSLQRRLFGFPPAERTLSVQDRPATLGRCS